MIANIRKALALLDTRSRRAVAPLLATFMLVGVLDAVGIGLVFPLIFSFLNSGLEEVSADSDGIFGFVMALLPQDGVTLGVMTLSIFLLKNLLSVFLIKWQYKVISDAEARTGTRLFATYLREPWTKALGRNSSELIRNATTSNSYLFLSFFVPIITIFAEGILVFLVFLVLFFADPVIASCAAVVLSFVGVIYYFLIMGRMRLLGGELQEASYDLLLHLKQGIAAGREVRVLGRYNNFIDHVADARKRYAKAQRARSFFTHLPRYYFESVMVVIVAISVVTLLPSRDPSEFAAVLTLFGVAALRLISSANRIVGAMQQARVGVEAVRIVSEDLSQEICGLPDTHVYFREPKIKSGLFVDKVSFSYGSANETFLSDVSFDLPLTGSIGVIGPSGSGKSTLVDIILGLLPPQAGGVFFDGVDVRSNLSRWQNMIGFVPQSIILTDDTLRRNVAFGLPDDAIDEGAVWSAIRMAQLEDMVAALPLGLDNPLGDLGTRLSGGQRQRVGIARALYHDPRILVLDEATSALDGETEEAVVAAIEGLAERKTLIVVAHRLSTVRRCDRLLVLEAGRVVGFGPTDEIMRENSVVQRLLGRSDESSSS